MQKHQSVYNEPMGQNENILQIANIFQNFFKDSQPIVLDQQQIRSTQKNHQRQRVIHMDCLRTRSIIFSQQLKDQLQMVLTHYCKKVDLNYKQGLNQIAGPFIYFRKIGLSLVQCQNLFHSFFSRYCLNFYQDQDFSSLQVFFKMLSIVLKYHNPSVSRYLQFYDIQPQIFCIGWLMTLFASKLSLKMTYQLWQYYMIQDDKFFLFFIVVGIVIYNKNVIIEAKTHSVFQTITDMIFKTQNQMKQIILLSLIIRKNTPSSLLIFFRDRQIFENRTKYNDVKKLLSHIQKLNLFLILGSQISLQKHFALGLCQQHCYFCALRKPIIPLFQIKDQFLLSLINISNDIRTMDLNINFAVIDLRRDKSQPVNHHGSVFQVDLDRDIQDVEQQFLQRYIEEKSITHFMFLLTQFTFQDVELVDDNQFKTCLSFIEVLNSLGFPFLGILEGGYAAYQNLAIQHQSKVRMSRVKTRNSNRKVSKQLTEKSYQQTKQIQKQKPQKENSIVQRLEEIPIIQIQVLNVRPLQITISTLFYISNLVQKKLMRVFTGSKQIMLLTQYVLILLEKNKKLQKVANHMQHSTSIIDFMFDNPDHVIKVDSFKYYMIGQLTKTKVKLHNQNVLVLCIQTCELHSKKKKQFNKILKLNAQIAVDQYNQCKLCAKKQSKQLFLMNSYDQVEQCSQAIKRRFKNFIKILKGELE